jgi:hypothetical protein
MVVGFGSAPALAWLGTVRAGGLAVGAPVRQDGVALHSTCVIDALEGE